MHGASQATDSEGRHSCEALLRLETALQALGWLCPLVSIGVCHRIIEHLGLDGTFKHQGQGHLPVDQLVQSPTQPGTESF